MLLLLLAPLAGKAQTFQSGDYEYYLPYAVKSFVSGYSSVPEGPSFDKTQLQCRKFYGQVQKKQALDVRIALGYFDDTTGKETKLKSGASRGYSPSLDIVNFNALRSAITTDSHGVDQKLCGFKEVSSRQGLSILERKTAVHGTFSTVRITLTQPSASYFFAANTGPLKATQKNLSRQSEENYFGGMGSADIVFYIGHSRNGGGPDFNPPLLDAGHEVRYTGYYERKEPGLEKLLTALAPRVNSEVIVGLFSCLSLDHFSRPLLEQNPNRKLILTDTVGKALSDYTTVTLGALGFLEGFLRGRCGSELAEVAEPTEILRNSFKLINLN